MRRDEIIVPFGKQQIAHLALSVPLQHLTLLSQTPYSHSTVRCPRASGEVAHLSIGPLNRFHCRFVGLLEHREVCLGREDEHFVVVAARGEILFVGSPTQATYFLSVMAKNLDGLSVEPQVIHQNAFVLRASN